MKKFRTEVSWKILGPILFIFGITIFLIYKSGGNIDEIFALIGGSLALTLYLVYGISYDISDLHTLKVRAGIFYNINVPIEQIHTIEKTNSILSAPASSLDRIEVKYNKYDSVVISPKNRAEFIQELLKINPNITIKL
jgi:hypothetical protein